jgi:hypothetical protein
LAQPLDRFRAVESALVIVKNRDFHGYKTAMPAISIR